MWLLVCIFIMHECLYFALVFEDYIISLALGVKVEVFLSKHFKDAVPLWSGLYSNF